jgi:hypothetical protein
MDSFDLASLTSFVKKYKKDVLTKIDSLQLSEKTISNQSDLVCMVLDYSPRFKEVSKSQRKYKLKQSSVHMPDLILKSQNSKSLNLEKQQNNSSSSEHSDDNNNASEDDDINGIAAKPYEYNSYMNEPVYFIKEFLYQIIDNVVIVARNSKSSSLLSNNKIRVYILNTTNFIELTVKPDDTFFNLKKVVLNCLENAVNMNINYHTPDAYEFRFCADTSPIMTSPPIDNNTNIFDLGKDNVCFIEKQNYISTSKVFIDNKPKKLYGSIISNSEDLKINLKIYIKLDINNVSSTIIQMSTENTLQNVLEQLAMKKRLTYKNLELYYFVEHNDSSDNEEMDNAIRTEMLLKYLTTYELDLYFKKFPDMPDYLFSFSQTNRINLTETNTNRKSKLNDDDNIREFIFNDVSAGVYQEFEVYNKNKQERILGIDMYNLYNDLPKNKRGQKGTFFLFNSSEMKKNPLRKIKDVKACGAIGNKGFYIDLLIDGETRQNVFEAKTVNIRNEIVGKLNYLINMNKK